MPTAACVTTAALKVIGESIARRFVQKKTAPITRVLKRMGHAVSAVSLDIMDTCVAVKKIAFVEGTAVVVGVSMIPSMGHFVARSVVIHVSIELATI
jgi:hypothetical protein